MGQSFGGGEAERGKQIQQKLGGRGLMMRGVQSGRFLGEGWMELEAGCVMMMDVIYRLDHPSPPQFISLLQYVQCSVSQSQSSLVSPPPA